MIRRWLLAIAGLVLVVAVGATAATGTLQTGASTVAQRVRGLRAAMEVADVVHGSYVNPVTRYALLEEYVRSGSVNKMLSVLGDPYTRYMGAGAWASLREETRGTFQGIGVIIAIKDNCITVISPIEGTPGFRAGLKPEDRIDRIDGRTTKDMTTEQAADLMRGRKGTKVRLELSRGKGSARQTLEVTVTRANIEVPSATAEQLSDHPEIGYARISSFAETTSKELHKGLSALRIKGVKGLVLDLRYNPGGLLDQAVGVCGEFLKPGMPVLNIRARGDQASTYRTSTGDGYWGTLPLVILTNEGTASAAEIVTGALQDYGVATVVGTKTFGKGLIQTVVPLASGGGVTVTTAKYLTPKLRAINAIGILPDVLVRLPAASSDSGKTGAKASSAGPVAVRDTQLDKAVEILREAIESAGRKRGAA